MGTVHRTLDGDWAECANPSCRLLFHISNLTVEEVEAIDLYTLLPLFEAVQPPFHVSEDGTKVWMDEPHVGRKYDLPAVVFADGRLEWWRGGMKHRFFGKPAAIWPDGYQENWVAGVRVPKPLSPEAASVYQQWRDDTMKLMRAKNNS